MAHDDHLLKSLERALELKVVHTAQCERAKLYAHQTSAFPPSISGSEDRMGPYEGRNLGKIDSI